MPEYARSKCQRVAHSKFHRSLISVQEQVNGSGRHVVKINERTLWGRRFREISENVAGSLGGIGLLSEAQKQLIRRLVSLSVVCEGIEVELAQAGFGRWPEHRISKAHNVYRS